MDIYDCLDAALPSPGGVGSRQGSSGLIELAGPEAADFLQSLCSQDVLAIAPGEARAAAFLTAKGKLITVANIGFAAESLWLEAPIAQVDELAALLDRYHFAEKLSIRRCEHLVASELWGRDVSAHTGLAAWSCEVSEGVVILTGARYGVSWARRYAPVGAVWDAVTAVPELSVDLATGLRLAAGLVEPGRDTDAQTIALEAGLDDHVSTTKGCYVGQEVVARIHTYGHVNRQLTLVELATTAAVELGTALCDRDDGEAIGRVLSVVPLPAGERSIGFALLPKLFLDEPEPLGLGTGTGPLVSPVPFRRG